MPRKTVCYFFGRLNILGGYEDKRTFLKTALTVPAWLETRGARWGYFDIDDLVEGEDVYLHGYLVKFKSQGEEEVVDPTQMRLSDARIANQVLGKSRFFLHVPTGAIAFHPVAPHIRRQVFADRFAELFNRANDEFFVQAEVQFVQEPEKVLEALHRFQRISRLQVSLHPSNPHLRKVWRHTDERLKALEAKTYREEYQAAIDGSLRIDDDVEIVGKVTMAEDGYGVAKATGTMDGRTRTVTTRDNPITADAPTDEQDADTVLKTLMDTFRRIAKRFQQ